MKRAAELSLSEYERQCAQAHATTPLVLLARSDWGCIDKALHSGGNTRHKWPTLGATQRAVIAHQMTLVQTTDDLAQFDEACHLVAQCYRDLARSGYDELHAQHKRFCRGGNDESRLDELLGERLGAEQRLIAAQQQKHQAQMQRYRWSLVARLVRPPIPPLRYLALSPLVQQPHHLRFRGAPYFEALLSHAGDLQLVGACAQLCSTLYCAVAHSLPIWRALFQRSDCFRAMYRYNLSRLGSLGRLTTGELQRLLALDAAARRERQLLQRFMAEHGLPPPYSSDCALRQVFMLPRLALRAPVEVDAPTDCSVVYDSLRRRVVETRRALIDRLCDCFDDLRVALAVAQ